MKICNIIYSYSPYTCGGADLYAEKISTYLAEMGFDSVVITTEPGKITGYKLYKKTNNFRIYKFSPLNIAHSSELDKLNAVQKIIWTLLDIINITSYKIIKDILKKEKPDIVHFHTPLGISLLSFKAAYDLKIPTILTLHDFLLICRRSFLMNSLSPNIICKIYRIFSRIITNKINVIISPSSFMIEKFNEEKFFKKSKKIVLSNSASMKHKTNFNETRFISNEYNILYLGSLSTHKGLKTLINSFLKIMDDKKLNNYNISLHIAGNGPLWNFLKNFSENYKNIYLYGHITGKDKYKLLAKSNVLVLPSICYENSPTVIYEAFNYGIPVIASDVGGINELIIHGHNGFLFKRKNDKELMYYLKKIILKKELYQYLSKNAYESSKNSDFELHMNKLAEIYYETVKK